MMVLACTRMAVDTQVHGCVIARRGPDDWFGEPVPHGPAPPAGSQGCQA